MRAGAPPPPLLLLALCAGVASAARVVVVGGGFAGLGAATQLEADGHNVTLVEARGRLGGRAFTDTTTFGMNVDMGAMWIHGIAGGHDDSGKVTHGNPVYALAQKYGVKTTMTDYDNLKYFSPTGEELNQTKTEAMYDKLAAQMEKYRAKHDDDDNDYPLSKAMEDSFKVLKLSKDDQDLMRFKICDELELDLAASVYNMSGWWYDDDDYLDGGDALISDEKGYAGIVGPVAAQLKDVRLNTTVTAVTYKPHVSVETSAGTITADYIIITASLGTLKRDLIQFSPALPKKLTQAITKMGCDVSDKVVLQFPKGSEADWGGTGLDVFYHVGEEPAHHGEFTENWNIAHYNGRDMLMSFSAGTRDWAVIEGQTDAEVQAAALKALRTAYPKLPDPIKMAVHRWGNDPLASCTWSTPWAVGSDPKDTKQFLKGSGKLVFAGEHADHSHPGTTHGAWNTGLSAAAAVKAAVAAGGSLSPDAAEALRTRLQTPDPKHVLKRRPLRNRRREWAWQQRQRA